MKIIHISSSDSGGAGRAAYRIHKSLLSIGVDSEMWVNRKKTRDSKVLCPAGKFSKFLAYLKPHTRIPFRQLLLTKNTILHSPAIFASSWIRKINQSDADIINLHWVQHEMLSISDIAKIKKPIVWTLHDMWVFCGAEHISWDKRWKNGYYSFNRPSHEKGFDLNKWTWERKKKYWKKTYQIITPSNWLSKCVKQSKLMFKWPVTTIGNPIDTRLWKPENKKKCRDFFKFSHKDKILLFGTFGSNLEYHKGFDILKKTLRQINNKNLKLVIFGENKKIKFSELDTQVIDIGFIKKNEELKYLYSAADATIIPSRIESFGQMASESSACGTPVIAFRTGGLKDIVEHKITGYLAKNFESEDLANGINWILSSKNKKKISQNARKRIINNFDNYKIAKKYLKVYCKNIVSKIDLSK
jgi:glycosyltransferase involved in cell wall biosynthesis